MIENVYVSFTYELRPFVDAARKGIERLKLTPIIFDENITNRLNLSNTELMARNLNKSDVFVGIYARRYGGIPSMDLTGQPNTGQKSYIDLEYTYAVDHDLPRIIFFLAKNAQNPVIQTEGEPGAIRLREFRQRIMDRDFIRSYASRDELLIELLMYLGSLLKPESVFGDPSNDPQFKQDIFMVMPFDEQYRPIYTDHIQKVVTGKALTIRRGDNFFADQSIIEDIWAAIANCRLVIAECTGKNPNVFYELGIAHTLGKPTILITQDLEDVPFDVRHMRAIKYAYTPVGMVEFERQLDQAISSLLK